MRLLRPLMVILAIGILTAAAHAKTWIDEVTSDGAVIILADDTIWRVSALDRIDTMLWLPTETIEIFKSKTPGVYVMVNVDDRRKKVYVTYLGKR